MSFRRASFIRSFVVPALFVAATLSAAACSSDRRVRASFPVTADTLEVYPFSTSPAGYPTAVSVALPLGGVMRGVALPADGSGQYDIAFDLPGDGTVTLMPIRTILSPVSGAPQVGIHPVAESFESITAAPDTYYRPDTATNVAVGQTVLFVTYRRVGSSGMYGYGGTLCDIVATPRVFGKMVIDSVRGSNIYFRQIVNPNCGYRSLTPGFPSF